MPEPNTRAFLTPMRKLEQAFSGLVQERLVAERAFEEAAKRLEEDARKNERRIADMKRRG